jgi:hypothetical protein
MLSHIGPTAHFEFDCPPKPETFAIALADPARVTDARRPCNGFEESRKHGSDLDVKTPAEYNSPWTFHLAADSVSMLKSDGFLPEERKS